MQQYINTIGTTGMAALPKRPLFKNLNKDSTFIGRQIEAKYPNGSINTHYPGIDSITGLLHWFFLLRKLYPEPNDIFALTGEPGYIKMVNKSLKLKNRLAKRLRLYYAAVQHQL